MSHERKDGGFAFPCDSVNKQYPTQEGMSLRDYACINLKVPKSDKEWLNELITDSLRNEFAGQVINGDWPETCGIKVMSVAAYDMADVMLEAMKARQQ